MLPRGWLGPQKYPGQNGSSGQESAVTQPERLNPARVPRGPQDPPPQTLVFYEVSVLRPPEPPPGTPPKTAMEAPRKHLRGETLAGPRTPQEARKEAAGASQDPSFTLTLLAALS